MPPRPGVRYDAYRRSSPDRDRPGRYPRGMENAGWTALAALMGVSLALQSALMGAAGRERGPLEAVYISLVITAGGVAVGILLLQAGLGDVDLPSPIRQPWLPAAVVVVTGGAFLRAMRDLPPIYGIMGLLGLVFMLGAPVVVPEVGVALFVAGSTAGSLLAALVFDHWGWFGSDIRRVNAGRAAGVLLLIAGVILIAG